MKTRKAKAQPRCKNCGKARKDHTALGACLRRGQLVGTYEPRVRVLTPEGRAKLKASAEATTLRRKQHDKLAAAILDLCKWRKWPAVRTESMMTFNRFGQPRRSNITPGWPDITGAMPPTGRLWCIEVKTEDAELMRNQPEVQQWLIDAGAAIYTCNTVSKAEEFLKLLASGESLKKAA